MTTWRCPIITEMGMCPETGIECPAHDPQCPHLSDEWRPEMKEETPMTKSLEGEVIRCPKCGGGRFILHRVRLSSRMLARARLDVICAGCAYSESLYKIGEDK
ncbi:unnamed protein product [marine sediment metagenome]|uniref:Uncharacterized protein n=1 Tax=marine sediment metagenome TaxID=412755 RepID=X1FU72_9ZZZZ